MLIVSAVAVLSGAGVNGARMYRLSREYRNKADRASNWQRHSIKNLERIRDHCNGLAENGQIHPESFERLSKKRRQLERPIRIYSACAACAAMLKQKYERAASHPWKQVAPDPPMGHASLGRCFSTQVPLGFGADDDCVKKADGRLFVDDTW
jgi:hypothetical protein